jgi:hypothetical protein
MDSNSTFDLADLDSGSRLLSDTSELTAVRPKYGSSSAAAHHADLSLSELSLRPEPAKKPFRLIPAKQEFKSTAPHADDTFTLDNLGDGDSTTMPDDTFAAEAEPNSLDEAAHAEATAQRREEGLQHDLFMMRKMNATLEVYHNALTASRASRQV